MEHKDLVVQSACIILMYDITSMTSFRNVTERIYPQVKSLINQQYQFVILIGNKIDLSEQKRMVQLEVAQSFANQEAILMNEMSSLNMLRVDSVLRMVKTKSIMLLERFQSHLDTPGVPMSQ